MGTTIVSLCGVLSETVGYSYRKTHTNGKDIMYLLSSLDNYCLKLVFTVLCFL